MMTDECAIFYRHSLLVISSLLLITQRVTYTWSTKRDSKFKSTTDKCYVIWITFAPC